ncbi:sugar-binding transcriptional regulator [Microbacterium sp. gxy059]|uniref:sugar-binding transcriptional regulator n=1 Tax=Microbacterium sp. gxy059 TaxID=2957199 RepID=UPI003D9781B6
MQARDQKAMQALRAAQLYYQQDRTMEAIAHELRTSRSSVSRLLSYAREIGIVDIRVSSPLEHAGILAKRIHSRYGVSAHVVPMPGSVSETDRLDRVAMTGAHLLAQFMESNMVVGVAWGSTVSAVSRHLTRVPVHGTTFVQLNGAGNTLTTGVEYSSEILVRFREAFDAKVQQFPVPAFFDDPRTRDAMWRERMTQRVLGLQSRMDIALFSVGSPAADVPSQVYVGGYLEDEDYRQLEDDGAIGDVATVFYRADGSWRDIALNHRATGPSLDRLRRVPRRICAVAGTHKLAALRGALAGELVTDLVVDELLASRLIEAP